MVDRLEEEQLKQLRTSFTLLDGDGDGRVDAVDIQKFLGTFGAHFSLEEVEEFINEESAHPNGVMALCRSFISMVTPARSSPGAGLP
mmetsp:Transcript_46729/g.146515  ORF Transcript_46729/g.146515 Transcript_46729/m.146515 type:complete len:87 (-) Transcript_46729:537-797(-)